MPLFFLISGYCFDVSKHPSFQTFAKKRIEQILLPCILYSTIYFIYNCTQGRGFEASYHGLPERHLWFLMALFTVEVVSHKVLNIYIYIKKEGVCLLILMAGVFHNLQLSMNYHLIHFPMCLFYYRTGNLLRENRLVLQLLKGEADNKLHSTLSGGILLYKSLSLLLVFEASIGIVPLVNRYLPNSGKQRTE